MEDVKRETKKYTTPSGKEVELKTYITGREKRSIQNIFLGKIEMSVSGKETQLSKINGDLVEQAENKSIEVIVVSVGGNTENVVDLVLDLRAEDYDFVIKEINLLTAKKEEEDTPTA